MLNVDKETETITSIIADMVNDDKESKVEVIENTGNGAFFALHCYGAADKYMFGDSNANDNDADVWYVTQKFLKKRHNVAYQKLEYTKGINDSKNSTSFTLTRACDCVNSLDLVIHDPDHLGIDGILNSIVVEIGGQQMDRWYDCSSVLIETACAIFGRKVTRQGNSLIIPIALAPFHDYNLLALCALEHHDVKIWVKFKPGFVDACKTEIYGNVYFFDERKMFMGYNMSVAQCHFGSNTLSREGGGTSTHDIGFNHPMTMLFFWGISKTTITNVKLTLDNHVFYDGPIGPLEHKKEQRGLGHVEPIIIFFAQASYNSPYQSTVNFSRLDKPLLYISTTSTTASVIQVMGIGVQPLRIMQGMAGLAFSK